MFGPQLAERLQDGAAAREINDDRQVAALQLRQCGQTRIGPDDTDTDSG